MPIEGTSALSSLQSAHSFLEAREGARKGGALLDQGACSNFGLKGGTLLEGGLTERGQVKLSGCYQTTEYYKTSKMRMHILQTRTFLAIDYSTLQFLK